MRVPSFQTRNLPPSFACFPHPLPASIILRLLASSLGCFTHHLVCFHYHLTVLKDYHSLSLSYLDRKDCSLKEASQDVFTPGSKAPLDQIIASTWLHDHKAVTLPFLALSAHVVMANHLPTHRQHILSKQIITRRLFFLQGDRNYEVSR